MARGNRRPRAGRLVPLRSGVTALGGPRKMQGIRGQQWSIGTAARSRPGTATATAALCVCIQHWGSGAAACLLFVVCVGKEVGG